MFHIMRNARRPAPAPVGEYLELVVFVPVGELELSGIESGFLAHLTHCGLFEWLVFGVFAAGDRLPESWPVCALHQQHLKIGRVHHHKHRNRDFVGHVSMVNSNPQRSYGSANAGRSLAPPTNTRNGVALLFQNAAASPSTSNAV